MIVYKTVYVNRGDFTISSAIRGRQGYQQIYVPGEVARAELGWLFAFRSALQARKMACRDFMEVWAARTTCCEDMKFVPGDGLYDEEQSALTERFEAFWKCGVILGVPMKTPPGTVICPELTLLRAV